MPLANVIAGIVKARDDEEFTDLTIICEETKLAVHKVVICTQSSVFHAACTGPYKEAQSGTYTIKDFSPRAVHKMIDYLYTGDYSETSDEGGSDAMDTLPSSLSFHATMFGIGEIYCVEGLKCVSIQKYRATLTQDSNISNFLRSLLDVYCLTPDTVRDLRDTAITFAREELAVSLASKDVQQVYEEVVDAIPEFTKDLSKSFLQKPFIGTCTTCGHNKVVPIEILQCRCKKCGRGGARAFDGRAKAFQHPW